jgi:hypothetical protein
LNRASTGMGERLTWCQNARPVDRKVGRRVVAASAQKVVLWALTNRSNADGSCFPRQEVLAAETCLSRQSVNAALQALSEQELISIEIDQEHRRSRVYRLNVSQVATHQSAPSVASRDESSDQQVPDLSQAATPPVASRDTNLSQGATPIEPPVEPPIEPKIAPTAPAPHRDELFETVCEVSGIRWKTRERWTRNFSDRVNAAVGQIRDAGYSPTDVRRAADEYVRRNPRGTPLTPFALASQIPALADGELVTATGAGLNGHGDVASEIDRRLAEERSA